LALWSVISTIFWPVLKGLAFVAGHAEIDRQRKRAVLVTFGSGALIVTLAMWVPMPSWTNAEGLVWVPENAEVRAATGGFVTRVLKRPGQSVAPGDALLELTDADADAALKVHQSKVEQMQVQLSSEMFEDRLKAELTRQSLEAERAVLANLERRADELIPQASRAGNWTVPNADDLEGKYFPQGTLIGYVVSGSLRTVRVVVSQEDAELVRLQTQAIELRLADRPWQTIRARSAREVPGGSQRLPSKALALDGGGSYATDPRDSSGLKTLVRTFQLDLELDSDLQDLTFGTRAYVRFNHAWEPLARQGFRRVRQLFLSRLAL
jgi:putative peptide zinc metalloprotease protein